MSSELQYAIGDKAMLDLRIYVAKKTIGSRCDNTFHHTLEWMKEHGIEADAETLSGMTGQHCDCEIVMNGPEF